MNHRAVKLGAVKLALFLIGFCFISGFSVAAHAQSANRLYKQAQSAEARDDIESAFDLYQKAFQRDPKNLRFRTSMERTRFPAAMSHIRRGDRLRDQGDNTGALTEFLHALEIDPSNQMAQQEIQATREKINAPPNQETSLSPNANPLLTDIGGPPELKPLSNEPITLHMVEDSKIIYQTVGKAAGINVLFDPDYTSKRVQVDLTNVSLYDALRIIGTITGTFWRPITANTIFVAQNNRGKRAELDEEAVQTFYLTNVSQQQDLNDVQTALRNVFTTAKLYAVPSQSAIIMRGTPDELLLAQKLIGDLDKARPEVVIDIAVMEVNRDKTRQIGIQLPQTATINFQQSNANSTSSTSSSSTSSSSSSTTTTSTTNSGSLTLNDLAHLNATNFAVTIGQAQANLLLNDSDTKVLQNPRIRASDGQQATLKIGEKVPIATGSFQTGAATAIVSSLVNTQFQYLDVGVNIDMKPTVHYDRDVTIKMKIEVSNTNGNVNLGGISQPIITQRTTDQTIRLKEGEASILGGILTKEDNRSLTGTPWLAELPILRYIFGSETHEVQDDEIVFLVIPHVIRAEQLSPLNTRLIDTGTTNTIELRHTQSDTPKPVPAALPAQSGGPPPPGQTAQTAAASALGQMQQQANAGVPVSLQLVAPPAAQKVGGSFQVAVNLAGGQDVFSVPLQLQYDNAKLSLINVDLGNFLGKDGQAIALVHRDDGSGGVAISASRPPGVGGVSGAGSVVLLTFQAKAPGDASIAITRPVVRNSTQQAVSATGSQAVVHVQ
jgi:general secretion pathway protein D